ncbi:MAG: DUF1836 domain-containing protein [Oscillospiraceae bacterium]|nr:DUF1836 domain-containing protein [Oscillospiraceae bacterium]
MTNYDKSLVVEKLNKWDRYVAENSLPSWDRLPSLELYMDQVIVLLSQYLSFMPQDDGEGPRITASIINNYVRMRVMPAPVKKKYSRIHIAYLIMICTLKQSLSISYIRKILPSLNDEERIRSVYSRFIEIYTAATRFFRQNARVGASELMSESGGDDDITSYVMSAVIVSNFSKFLAEKLLDLKNVVPQD